MPTETQQMLTALGALHDDIASILPQIDGEIDALTAARDDLRNVVRGEMFYVAYIDPDEAAPTNQDGGTFNTIHDAMVSAPFGSSLDIRLAAGKTHVVETIMNLNNRHVLVQRDIATVGANPIIEVRTFTEDGLSHMYGWSAEGGGQLRFKDCDIRMQDRLDASPWGNFSSLYRFSHATFNVVGFNSCVVSGPQGSSITSANGGGVVQMGLFNTTLDGRFAAVDELGDGSAIFGVHTLTLLNEAKLNDAGTIGVNILKN